VPMWAAQGVWTPTPCRAPGSTVPTDVAVALLLHFQEEIEKVRKRQAEREEEKARREEELVGLRGRDHPAKCCGPGLPALPGQQQPQRPYSQLTAAAARVQCLAAACGTSAGADRPAAAAWAGARGRAAATQPPTRAHAPLRPHRPARDVRPPLLLPHGLLPGPYLLTLRSLPLPSPCPALPFPSLPQSLIQRLRAAQEAMESEAKEEEFYLNALKNKAEKRFAEVRPCRSAAGGVALQPPGPRPTAGARPRGPPPDEPLPRRDCWCP
jgi:hypothetical protein